MYQIKTYLSKFKRKNVFFFPQCVPLEKALALKCDKINCLHVKLTSTLSSSYEARGGGGIDQYIRIDDVDVHKSTANVICKKSSAQKHFALYLKAFTSVKI